MDRRAFLGTVAGALLAAPLGAVAQPAAKVARLAYLGNDPTASPHLLEAFRQGLRDLGYVEGRNVVIDYRFAEGRFERVPAFAAELVALKVDVILAGTVLIAVAAKQAIKTIPIVLLAVADPVGSGLVTSLARPGGNVTGVSVFPQAELVGKRLELLKLAVPGVSRVAVLWQPGGYGEERAEKGHAEGSRSCGTGARGAGSIRRGARSRRSRQGLLGNDRGARGCSHCGDKQRNERSRLVGLAAKNRLPAAYGGREFVAAGGLIGYGLNTSDLFRHAATYVDKILKGAKPGDLPVEQPTKFELVINLKTAKALGLTIPPSPLQRADQVIE